MSFKTELRDGQRKAWFPRGTSKLYVPVELAQRRLDHARKLRFDLGGWVSGEEKKVLDEVINRGGYITDNELKAIGAKVQLFKNQDIPEIYAVDNLQFPQVDWVIGLVIKALGIRNRAWEEDNRLGRLRPHSKNKSGKPNILDVTPEEVVEFANVAYDDTEINPQFLADLNWLTRRKGYDSETLEWLVDSRSKTYIDLQEILWDLIPWETEYRDPPSNLPNLDNERFWHLGLSPKSRLSVAQQYRCQIIEEYSSKNRFRSKDKRSLERMAMLFPDEGFDELMESVESRKGKMAVKKSAGYKSLLAQLDKEGPEKEQAQQSVYKRLASIVRDTPSFALFPPETIQGIRRDIPDIFFQHPLVLNQLVAATCDYIDKLNNEAFKGFCKRWQIDQVTSLKSYTHSQKRIINYVKKRLSRLDA